MSSQWNTGLCACTMDVTQCLDTYCCGPCSVSRQCNAIEGRGDECDLMNCLIGACCGVCAVISIRMKVVEKYSIDEGSAISCLSALCCASCSLCQTHRELTARNTWPGGTLCHKQPGSYQSVQ
uniref:Uncharacterized protein n=1 Tax=Neobodo designis TaxID=312471 RepID=A0A7S1R5D3_NEODS|mmetsp:Transcript_8929/g.27716  ORF Transcript_8929/g.27716 Transcript_8929/m.27716 type:complete len:123 (+) Transcript_8929:29-397(+)